MALRRFRRRGRRSRRTGGVRRARRIVKRVRRRRIKRSRRKQKKKMYFWGYSGSNHLDVLAGQIGVQTPDGNAPAGRAGLFAFDDANEIFQQVKNLDDLIYPGMSSAQTLGFRGGRQNLAITAKGVQTYTVSNGNQAGAIWLEVYICRPRKAIPASGVGQTPDFLAADVVNNNRSNAFVTDYNDAQGINITAVTNAIANTTSQTKPSITTANFVVTPYMIPPFTENFKVVKQLKYVIPPGGQCMFNVKTKRTYINRNSYALKSNTGGTSASFGFFRPWFGKDVFFRFHGQPVHDTTAVDPNRPVNYGPATLDLVYTKKYWYSTSYRPLPSYVLEANVGQGVITTASLPSLPLNPVKED